MQMLATAALPYRPGEHASHFLKPGAGNKSIDRGPNDFQMCTSQLRVGTNWYAVCSSVIYCASSLDGYLLHLELGAHRLSYNWTLL
jgi:hypothetical protein